MNTKAVFPAFSKHNIPVVFSANDAFVPVMATMIQSVIENASVRNNYDILILTQDILPETEKKLHSMVRFLPNFHLRILDVSDCIRGYTFYIENRKTITVEAFFRLLIPDLLPNYEKVLYLDGDMIANADVARLYHKDIRNYLLASSRDPDSIGRCHKPGDKIGQQLILYRKDVLKIKNLDNFFCSGMLLMNLVRFRQELPSKKLLDFAVSYPWQQHDQDVLNALCQGKTKLVNMSWDVLRDAGNNRYMPVKMYEEYQKAEANPKIIHYGGMRKPWLYPHVERGEYFWRYAGRTPFYPDILSMVDPDNRSVVEELVRQSPQPPMDCRYYLRYYKAWIKRRIRNLFSKT